MGLRIVATDVGLGGGADLDRPVDGEMIRDCVFVVPSAIPGNRNLVEAGIGIAGCHGKDEGCGALIDQNLTVVSRLRVELNQRDAGIVVAFDQVSRNVRIVALE